MAALTDQIAASNPKVIVFDILFSEKELSEEQTLNEDALSSGDEAFQKAIEAAGNVVLPFVLDVPVPGQKFSTLAKEPPESILFSSYARVTKSAALVSLPEAIGALAPISHFADAAKALGHVFILPDRDGVLRREPLAVAYQGDYYPPIALQAARLYLDLPETQMALEMGKQVRLGKVTIPTDEIGRMTTDYFGPEQSYVYYSAADVVAGMVPPARFKGKVVVIGASAMATADSKVTPFSNNMMGFEKNATLIENILSNRLINRSEGRMKAINIALIILYGLILSILMPKCRAVGCALLSGGVFFGHFFLATLLFIRFKVWIDIFYPAFAVLTTYLVYTGFLYFTEEKRARAIRKMFQSYVSPRIVEEMIKHPELAKLGGSKQTVTILFSDVRGFTTFCEAHKDKPAEVVSILNEYLGAMTEAVFEWEGTLDKFVGDAVMVYWGAPLPQADHATRAIHCAIEMRHRLSLLQQKWKREGKPILDMGIGINTGEVIVGNIGAEGKKMDYTVIGDAVNLAARVESLTRKYESAIIIAEPVYKAMQDYSQNTPNGFEMTPLDAVQVKGKAETVLIYGILPLKKEGI
jgi:adenylate cyclase